MTNKNVSLSGRKLVDAVVAAALEKKAERIVVFKIENRSSIGDWFIVCQADNPVQCRAIGDGIVSALKERHTVPWLEEGSEEGRWVVIDYTDVIVHILLPQLREYYALESLWGDEKKTNITDC